MLKPAVLLGNTFVLQGELLGSSAYVEGGDKP
jgi:hypothetical protein